MKKFLSKVFSPITLILLALLIQLGLLVGSFIALYYFPWVTTIFDVLLIVVAFVIVNSKSGNSYKVSWFLLLVIFPFFGLNFARFGDFDLIFRSALRQWISEKYGLKKLARS